MAGLLLDPLNGEGVSVRTTLPPSRERAQLSYRDSTRSTRVGTTFPLVNKDEMHRGISCQSFASPTDVLGALEVKICLWEVKWLSVGNAVQANKKPGDLTVATQTRRFGDGIAWPLVGWYTAPTELAVPAFAPSVFLQVYNELRGAQSSLPFFSTHIQLPPCTAEL